MTRGITVIIATASMLGLAAPDMAWAQTPPGPSTKRAERSAQLPPRPARARTRIRVTPAFPYRLYSTPYPVPYPYEFPGPGFVRQCTSWLAPENRVSGPVIVPRMRCWWEPGRSDLISRP